MSAQFVAGQKQVAPCADANKYEYHNQVEPPALEVRSIYGRTVTEAQMTDYVKQIDDRAPGACLTLFTAKTHEPLSTVVADRKGHFRFGSVPDGDFRLVARLKGFCTANRLMRVRHARRGKSRSDELVVHFTIHAIDTCSYIAPAGKRLE
jgi:hypothetical protein